MYICMYVCNYDHLTIHFLSLHHIDVSVPVSSSRLPLLYFSSFTGHQMVSVFWTLWLCYSISKSLSWSWDFGMVRFRQLTSRPGPLAEDRYSAMFGVIGVTLFFPVTYVMSFQHYFSTRTHKLEFVFTVKTS